MAAIITAPNAVMNPNWRSYERPKRTFSFGADDLRDLRKKTAGEPEQIFSMDDDHIRRQNATLFLSKMLANVPQNTAGFRIYARLDI